MDRRGFLKSTLGLSAGIFAAQLALPGSVKCKMISPATDWIAKTYFDDIIKLKLNQFKKENLALKIGETHCHSTFSDGTSSVKDIINRASYLGLDFLILTEHLMPDKYPLEFTLSSIHERWRCVQEWNSTQYNPVKVYPAFEVSTNQGHLILVLDEFYLQRKTFKDIIQQFSKFNTKMGSMEEVAKLVKPFGGITIIPHPEKEKSYPFGASISFIKNNLLGLVDAIEDISTGHGYKENYSSELGLASIGSSDDHFNLIIGTTVTAYDSSKNNDFISAVKAKETKAIKIDDSLREFIAAARLII
ncbi:MAG: PHP domain-containing protein [Nitrospinota bacterium]